MRLLTKTSLLIITVSIFIFFVWNIVFFQISRQMIMKQVDSELTTLMHEMVQNMSQTKQTVHYLNILDFAEIEHINANIKIPPAFRDTLIFNQLQKKFVPHRILSFSFDNGLHNHRISIRKSLLETDLVIEKITLASIILIIVFIISIYFINRFIFENVWSSFFTTIKRMDKYDIKSKDELKLEASEIDEFEKLNHVLEALVNRIRKDYDNLKELTANTSHELQTPLAIIKGKAELLIQSENITEKEMELIGSIMETSDRLSNLNKSLLLISKIENDQFIDSEIISVKEKLEKQLEGFSFLLDSGKFKVKKEISDFNIEIHPLLFDVLITNLIKNAIVHNNAHAEISIEAGNKKIRIINTGNALSIDPNLIFKRFVRNIENKNSSGVGLELVKKICDYYDLEIVYSFENEMHCFELNISNIMK